MTHPPLFQLIGSPDKKTQGFPLPLPDPTLLIWWSSIFCHPNLLGARKARGARNMSFSQRRTFFKQQLDFLFLSLLFYLFIFCICLFASCSLIRPLLFRVIRWVDKRPMQFLQQNLTGLHYPPLFIGSSFNGCNVTLGLSAAFIATFSPVIKTECLNCTAWD